MSNVAGMLFLCALLLAGGPARAVGISLEAATSGCAWDTAASCDVGPPVITLGDEPYPLSASLLGFAPGVPSRPSLRVPWIVAPQLNTFVLVGSGMAALAIPGRRGRRRPR